LETGVTTGLGMALGIDIAGGAAGVTTAGVGVMAAPTTGVDCGLAARRPTRSGASTA
jgi:hypothetical protein